MTDSTAPDHADETPQHHASPQWAALEARFGGVSPTPQQLATIRRLHGAILDVAWLIETSLPQGRHRSIALTLLEDLQMRATRGIVAPDEPR